MSLTEKQKGMEITVYTDRCTKTVPVKLIKRRLDLEVQEAEKTGNREEIWEAEAVNEIVLITRHNPSNMFTIDPFLTEQELS